VGGLFPGGQKAREEREGRGGKKKTAPTACEKRALIYDRDIAGSWKKRGGEKKGGGGDVSNLKGPKKGLPESVYSFSFVTGKRGGTVTGIVLFKERGGSVGGTLILRPGKEKKKGGGGEFSRNLSNAARKEREKLGPISFALNLR